MTLTSLTLTPIGVIRTPFREKVDAPRQGTVLDAPGELVLASKSGFEHALSDLELWDHLWVLYWFHENPGWRPKVLPPRSDRRRGVFATRSPHRPNALGLTAVRLTSVEGLIVRVRGVDMLDGTPLLDIKPYVPYSDIIPEAGSGWLEETVDPVEPFAVSWEPLAADQAAWLKAEHGVDLVAPVTRTLALGPEPHPYRRIRSDGDAWRLGIKDWRVRFRVEGRAVRCLSLHTGYRPQELAQEGDPTLVLHREFVARFGLG